VPTNLTLDRNKQRALPVWLLILSVLLIVARIVSNRYPVEKDVDLVQWTPIASAGAIARRADMNVMYEFSADWCGPCRLLEREVFMDPRAASKINRLFIPVKVVDRHQEAGSNTPAVQQLMDRYGVTAFPTVIVAGTDGTVKQRIVGYTNSGTFLRSLFR
jgi:thiol:disulfide interchange protein